VVVESRVPSGKVVAGIAGGSCLQHRGVAGGSAGRQNSVVTLCCASSRRDANMVESGRNPGKGSVALVASVGQS